MKLLYTSTLCLITLLAAMPGASRAADLPVVYLAPTDAPAQVKAAKQAYENGSILAMKGGTVAGFEALLNISMPQSDSHHRQPPPCVQAARKMPSGRTRKFIRMSQPFVAGDGAACEAAFSKWLGRQSALEDASPVNADLWTAVEEFSLPSAWNSADGNSISLDVSVYRANTIDKDSDYYLVLNTMTLAARPGGVVSIPNLFASHAAYQNGVAAVVNGFGPQAMATSISLGQGISFSNYESGVYTASTANPPVLAREQQTPHANELIWEYFTNKAANVYQNAVIYQVPTGTSYFTLACAGTGTFSGVTVNQNFNQEILIHIAAPQVLMPELTFAMEGTKASFDVNLSPYLQTSVGSWPPWLPGGSLLFTDPNGNQTAAPPLASSYTISFNVPKDPSCIDSGTCSNLSNFTLETVPDFAAVQTKLPSVAVTTIDLVSNSPTAGVLIAGGQDWNGTALLTADIWDSQSGTVTKLPALMTQARYQHTATLIAPSGDCQGAKVSCPTTGQILIAGGYGANKQPTNTTEFFNPNTAQFSPGPPMTSPHAAAVALQLQDGRVLIMGGLDQTGFATSVVDIYDPRTNTFSSTPMSLTQPRWNFAANVLQDGSVLVEGGSQGPSQYDGPATSTAEKLDACTSGFYPLATGPIVPRQEQATTLLKNGQVLIVGGYNGNGNLNQVELFTPSSNSFSQVTSLQSDRRGSVLVRQEDGDVALIGGDNVPSYANVYDPSSQSFVNSLTTFMTEQRDGPTAVRLEGIGTADKGKILVAGGVIPQTGSSNGELVELYDPVARTWTTAGTLSASRRQNTTTLYGKYAGSLPSTIGCN